MAQEEIRLTESGVRRNADVISIPDKWEYPWYAAWDLAFHCVPLEKFQTDPHWRNLVLFYEYFHGDSGAGVGASHQTGWTGVVTKFNATERRIPRASDLAEERQPNRRLPR